MHVGRRYHVFQRGDALGNLEASCVLNHCGHGLKGIKRSGGRRGGGGVVMVGMAARNMSRGSQKSHVSGRCAREARETARDAL